MTIDANIAGVTIHSAATGKEEMLGIVALDVQGRAIIPTELAFLKKIKVAVGRSGPVGPDQGKKYLQALIHSLRPPGLWAEPLAAASKQATATEDDEPDSETRLHTMGT